MSDIPHDSLKRDSNVFWCQNCIATPKKNYIASCDTNPASGGEDARAVVVRMGVRPARGGRHGKLRSTATALRSGLIDRKLQQAALGGDTVEVFFVYVKGSLRLSCEGGGGCFRLEFSSVLPVYA